MQIERAEGHISSQKGVKSNNSRNFWKSYHSIPLFLITITLLLECSQFGASNTITNSDNIKKQDENSIVSWSSGKRSEELVVAGINGELWGISMTTGDILWNIQTDESIFSFKQTKQQQVEQQTTSFETFQFEYEDEDEVEAQRRRGANKKSEQEEHEEDIVLIPSPEGGIYTIIDGKMQHIGFTVKELLLNGPLLTDDGYLWMASKYMQMWVIDKHGQLFRHWSSSPGFATSITESIWDSSMPSLPPSSLLITKSTYIIQSVNPITGTSRWNLTLGEFVSSDQIIAAQQLHQYDSSQIMVSVDGAVYLFDPTIRQYKCATHLRVPIVASYPTTRSVQLPHIWTLSHMISPVIPPTLGSVSSHDKAYIGAFNGQLFTLPSPNTLPFPIYSQQPTSSSPTSTSLDLVEHPWGHHSWIGDLEDENDHIVSYLNAITDGDDDNAMAVSVLYHDPSKPQYTIEDIYSPNSDFIYSQNENPLFRHYLIQYQPLNNYYVFSNQLTLPAQANIILNSNPLNNNVIIGEDDSLMLVDEALEDLSLFAQLMMLITSPTTYIFIINIFILCVAIYLRYGSAASSSTISSPDEHNNTNDKAVDPIESDVNNNNKGKNNNSKDNVDGSDSSSTIDIEKSNLKTPKKKKKRQQYEKKNNSSKDDHYNNKNNKMKIVNNNNNEYNEKRENNDIENDINVITTVNNNLNDENNNNSISPSIDNNNNNNQSGLKVGKIELTSNILGLGSSGTIVYEGYLGSRRIAVKRMLRTFYEVAEKEILLLLQSDEHPNVVRYYTKEEDGNFIYLALSYCTMNVEEFIQCFYYFVNHIAVLPPSSSSDDSKQLMSNASPSSSVNNSNSRIKSKAVKDDVINNNNNMNINNDVNFMKKSEIMKKIEDANLVDYFKTYHQKYIKSTPKFSTPILASSPLPSHTSSSSSSSPSLSSSSPTSSPLFAINKIDKEIKRGMILDLVKGLRFLHSKNIVHRDLKPQNILIDHNYSLKISDMGLAKKLETNQHSFSSANRNGSFGWQPQELLQGNRLSKKVDIFALGCIIYYILTDGHHPFGDKFNREVNILNNLINLSKLEVSDQEAKHLILSTICYHPKARLSADDVAAHIYFWNDNKKLLFLKDASDRLEIEKSDSPLVTLFESRSAIVISSLELLTTLQHKASSNISSSSSSNINNNSKVNKKRITRRGRNNNNNNNVSSSLPSVYIPKPVTHSCSSIPISAECSASELLLSPSLLSHQKKQVSWMDIIDVELKNELEAGKHRKYNPFSLRDLLRVIRNKSHHYRDLPISTQQLLGDLPVGFLHYFTSKFPLLLIEVYQLLHEHCYDEAAFQHYFHSSSE